MSLNDLSEFLVCEMQRVHLKQDVHCKRRGIMHWGSWIRKNSDVGENVG